MAPLSSLLRQPLTYCLDRASFAKTFTGGYGGIVDGAYYAGSWMYKELLPTACC